MKTIYYKDAIVGEMVTGYLLIGNIKPKIETTLEELAAQQYFNGSPFFAADTVKGAHANLIFPEFPNGTDVNVYGAFVLNSQGELICACTLDEPTHGESGNVAELTVQVISHKNTKLKPYAAKAPPAKTIECSETEGMMSDIMRTLREININPSNNSSDRSPKAVRLPDWDEYLVSEDVDIDDVL